MARRPIEVITKMKDNQILDKKGFLHFRRITYRLRENNMEHALYPSYSRPQGNLSLQNMSTSFCQLTRIKRSPLFNNPDVAGSSSGAFFFFSLLNYKKTRCGK